MRPSPSVSAVRRIVSDRFARLIDFRVQMALPHERLAELDRRIGAEAASRAELDRELAAQRDRVEELRRRQDWTANELERVVPQVAALEARLASVDDLVVTAQAAGTASGGDLGAARAMIAEIRREHARVRVRLTGVAQYEERLGRLEERVGPA